MVNPSKIIPFPSQPRSCPITSATEQAFQQLEQNGRDARKLGSLEQVIAKSDPNTLANYFIPDAIDAIRETLPGRFGEKHLELLMGVLAGSHGRPGLLETFRFEIPQASVAKRVALFEIKKLITIQLGSNDLDPKQLSEMSRSERRGISRREADPLVQSEVCAHLTQLVGRACETLKPKIRQIIEAHFGFGEGGREGALTNQEIAEKLGLRVERVAVLLAEGLRGL